MSFLPTAVPHGLQVLLGWRRDGPGRRYVRAEEACDRDTLIFQRLLENPPLPPPEREIHFPITGSLGRVHDISRFVALKCLWAETLNLSGGRYYFYHSKALCCENILEPLCRRHAETPYSWRNYLPVVYFYIPFPNHIFISLLQTHRQYYVCQKSWIFEFQAVKQNCLCVLEIFSVGDV